MCLELPFLLISPYFTLKMKKWDQKYVTDPQSIKYLVSKSEPRYSFCSILENFASAFNVLFT